MNVGPAAAMKNALRCTVHRPYTRLYVISDGANWSLKNDASELRGIAHELGIPAIVQQHSIGIFNQALMFTSNFSCQRYLSWKLPSAVGVAWYHGRPCADFPEFKAPLDALRRYHHALARVQVSHTEMHDIILQTGIAPHKVHLIPIGINLRYFTMKNEERCREVRTKYGIPTSAVVVGSFQKDGNGWGEGLLPKLIKGPDIFVAVLDQLRKRRHDLHILLTGPARGYVKQRLSELGIPFTHLYFSDYAQVGELYQALDLYLVTSRQEGGPKAILESMASGIPLITTRVGQAMDLVRHGENGWMTEVEDVEALAHWAQYVIEHQASLDPVLRNGRMTAQQHSYVSQAPLWRAFFSGMVREGN
jgi:glycosyltransferase involved in cell wall biosynthesis